MGRLLQRVRCGESGPRQNVANDAAELWNRVTSLQLLGFSSYGNLPAVFVEAQLGSHILARQAARTLQNDAASFRYLCLLP